MAAETMKLDNAGGRERNVYSNPAVFGLTTIGKVDYSSGSYEFDLRVVWKDTEGRLWTARDSGCSCPMPFEGTHELERLFSWETLEREYEDEKYRSRTAWNGARSERWSSVRLRTSAMGVGSSPPRGASTTSSRFRSWPRTEEA